MDTYETRIAEDNTMSPNEKVRQQVRYASLMKSFIERHGNKAPEDEFEIYLLELITRLGHVYDKNSERIRETRRKMQNPKAPNAYLDQLYRRESFLDTVGGLMRKIISINVIHNPDVGLTGPISCDKVFNK